MSSGNFDGPRRRVPRSRAVKNPEFGELHGYGGRVVIFLHGRGHDQDALGMELTEAPLEKLQKSINQIKRNKV